MPQRPIHKKINPSMAPVTLIAVTSDTLPLRDLYGYADTIVRQRLSEIDGVGNIGLQGAAPASIRIAVDSEAIASFGLGFDDVRSTVQQSTMLRPLGSLDGGRQTSSLNVDDQLRAAEACGSLIIQTSNGAALRLSDVAVVQEDTADARVAGRYNGRIRDGRSLKESVTAAAHHIGFTIVAITLSLVAAFAPFFFLAGVVGSLLRESAVALCTAILISGLTSLTLTPALCARLLWSGHRRQHSAPCWLYG